LSYQRGLFSYLELAQTSLFLFICILLLLLLLQILAGLWVV
jgi:hypothetical protein